MECGPTILKEQYENYETNSILFGVSFERIDALRTGNIRIYSDQCHGKSVALSNYRGKVLLIVNTATRCGFHSTI